MTVVPRSGYTLPVFACAAAVAAYNWLREQSSVPTVTIDPIEPARKAEIAIAQVAGLQENMALAIAYSDPGDNLDLTRDTPIWAVVEWLENAPEQITIAGGEGIGRILDAGGKAAIYTYAQELLQVNLLRLLQPTEKIKVTIILPAGRALAQRTSNAAFGVVEGLSLLGTTGISQPLSAAGQLAACLEQVRDKAKTSDRLVFCIGENGLDLAQHLGINPQLIVKTANWIGPILVEAANHQVREILLFGYHGKLIKLAGGIFHTHHHLADGRLEILTACAAKLGLPTLVLQNILASPTTEAALKYLRQLDAETDNNWVQQLYQAIADTIDKRTQDYIHALSDRRVRVSSILFDRDRAIIAQSQTASTFLC